MTVREFLEIISTLNLPEDTLLVFNYNTHCDNCDKFQRHTEMVEFVRVESNEYGTKEINLY